MKLLILKDTFDEETPLIEIHLKNSVNSKKIKKNE